MFSRLFAALSLAALITLADSAAPAFAEQTQPDSHTPIPPHTNSRPALCPDLYQLQNPADCPAVGPGAYAARLVAAGLPYPLPVLSITPAAPYRELVEHAYARVITDTAPVYQHPLEALAGLPPMRRFKKGFNFVSLVGRVTVEGKEFYQINPGEYMRAEDLSEVKPSSFAGVHFSTPPGLPVGWAITSVQASAAPGLPPDPAAPVAGRYQFFTVLGVQRVGEWNWYLIGPDMWVEQRQVGLVQPAPPYGMGGTVIAVDTYEQTLGVYQNGALIFATLVSSGSRYFPTHSGTFAVWAKLSDGKMSGAFRKDRSDYYFLEDVPWILYYDEGRALHGAYWHDNFGTRSSHGCVNLSPRDARWLYDFASVGLTVVVFSSQEG